MKAEHFPALTGLRFVLALWVILHHLTGPGQHLDAAARALPHPLYALVRGGYLAVTTFFVLSGFVLARSYSAERWTRRTLLAYATGRIARVYPIYLLSLAVVAPFIAADQTAGKSGYLAAHFALLQGWLGHIPVNWNTPAWSLSCEIFFYAAFPLLAIPLARAGWRGTIAAAAVAVVLTRVLWAIGVSDEIKPLIHTSDFLMGIAASRAFGLLRARGTVPHGAWWYVPAFLASGALIAWPEFLPPRVDLNTALRPLNAALLIGLASGGGFAARILALRPTVFLGKASYAMYILHIPLMWWYLRWTREFSAAVYIGAVIALSAIVYRVIEEPANRYLRGRARVALQA